MAIARAPVIPMVVPIPKAHFSLEGIDGVGKTTQLLRLEKELTLKGIPVQIGRCPSATPVGEFLHSNMGVLGTWERNTLFLMDMIETLRTNDSSGKILLWDRYKDSNRVANKDMTLQDAEASVACLPETTRTFLLDLDPETIIVARKESLHGDSLDLEWQREKRRRYLRLAERDHQRVVVIDAAMKESDITTRIVRCIIEDLKKFDAFDKSI